jgi:hypothetical protein
MIYFLNIDWSAHEIPRLMLTTGPTKDQQLETGDAVRISLNILSIILVLFINNNENLCLYSRERTKFDIFVLIAAVLRVSIKGMIQVNLNLTYNRSDDHLRADINPHYIEG